MEVSDLDNPRLFRVIPKEYSETYAKYFDVKALKKMYGHLIPDQHKKDKKTGLQKQGFCVEYARQHPVVFAYFMLGKRIRLYQAFAIDLMLHERRLALNWARRLGKTTCIALVSFWLTYFNKEPKNAMEKFTEIGIVSKEEDAAKKILTMVRDMIYDGDTHMRRIISDYKGNYFSDKLGEPNNTSQLTWAYWGNRSILKSLPPTKKVRSNGFSRLFIDEIAYLEPKDQEADTFYTAAAKPTVADTNGYICISSTPNGKNNLFYELFDPGGEHDSEYKGVWFDWEINGNDQNYSTYVEAEKIRLLNNGRMNLFRQEFNGEFTVTENSFFDLEAEIAPMFDSSYCPRYEWKKTACSIGLDYGISKSYTVITVKTLYYGKVMTLYRRVFPLGFDINELQKPSNDDSIPGLMKRYDVSVIMPDLCPQGDMINRWMKNEGLPVQGLSFQDSSDKNKALYTYKTMLRNDKLRCFPDELFKQELMSIQETQMKIRVSIGKPTGGHDDMVDSDVLATIPFFESDDGNFGVVDYDQDAVTSKRSGLKVDTAWDELCAKSTYDDDLKKVIEQNDDVRNNRR